MSSQKKPENIHLRWRKTKILATLGPASNSEKKITELINAGANIFRLNMSHGTHHEHRIVAQRIRKISKSKNLHLGILMDLCGPKIRVGIFENGEINIQSKQTVIISCSAKIGTTGIIPSQYKNLYKDVQKNSRILLDDGKLELRVLSIKNKEIKCMVIYGGILKNNKGFNLPDSNISTTSFTPKDKRDAQLAIELEADFIALSFVRSEKCIKTLKRFITKQHSDIPIIAKIEKPEAIDNIDNILQHADGIMVARGDLGIEIPAQQVPLIQKDLINKARLFGKPVIVATQMLESMINSSKPTRAEVGDVATAALSSTDAVMLSAETASGCYPVLSVKIMDEILREIEAYQWQHGEFGEVDFDNNNGLVETDRKAIAKAVKSLATELKLQGILVPTRSGATAKILSADRPEAPLIGISSNQKICRRLSLNWGVIPMHITEKITNDWQALCDEVCTLCKLTESSNRVLLVSGFNENPSLNEPVLKLMRASNKRSASHGNKTR